MHTNPSVVDDAGQPGNAPALWNPNAAARWSLLLSPAFGAYLHMKNWQALGEPKKAASAKRWIVAVLAIVGFTGVFGAFLPDGASRFAGIALLIGWYFGGARSQAAYVKERYGVTYPRKRWPQTLFYGVLACAAFISALLLVFLALQALARRFL